MELMSQKAFTDSFLLLSWNSSPEATDTEQKRGLNGESTKERIDLQGPESSNALGKYVPALAPVCGDLAARGLPHVRFLPSM